MQPEDIDKLFRAKLEQHATPPPPSLWYDLQEQLEPEEKKRRGGFWMYAVAAAVTLLLVAGGGWLMWQSRLNGPAAGTGTLATHPTPNRTGAGLATKTAPATPAAPNATPNADFEAEAANGSGPEATALAARTATTTSPAQQVKKSASAQATDALPAASTHQQPQLLARTERRAAARRETDQPEAPDFRAAEPRPSESQAVAVQPVPASVPAPTMTALVPANAAVATAPSMGTIEVEVRQQPANVVALADANDTPGRTRPSVRGVLRQVRRLAQGERPDLTEVGLPSNPALTVQARVAGHTLTKTIAL
ncbi:hypothetical protein [Hymenobacter sp. CRA2]|uniref:hypothetical protein n=1 Tax=Hymenobacter sp. CRA2 TaxID=1955620 RepID=UPI00098F4A47|nr:hypothetical protein [Hymenobacter sp. CRA2]OON69513.1 hypothetical protein B0919_09590 [Hymenobacter sp. CRA2]